MPLYNGDEFNLTDWQGITNKPTSFPTTWADVADKPVLADNTQVNGLWTPSIAGSVVAGNNTYASTDRYGWSSQTGKRVELTFGISVTAFDPAIQGDILLTGLPYTISNSVSSVSAITFSQHDWFQFPTGYFQVFGSGIRNTKTAGFRFCGSNILTQTCTHLHLREKLIVRGVFFHYIA